MITVPVIHYTDSSITRSSPLSYSPPHKPQEALVDAKLVATITASASRGSTASCTRRQSPAVANCLPCKPTLSMGAICQNLALKMKWDCISNRYLWVTSLIPLKSKIRSTSHDRRTTRETIEVLISLPSMTFSSDMRCKGGTKCKTRLSRIAKHIGNGTRANEHRATTIDSDSAIFVQLTNYCVWEKYIGVQSIYTVKLLLGFRFLKMRDDENQQFYKSSICCH